MNRFGVCLCLQQAQPSQKPHVPVINLEDVIKPVARENIWARAAQSTHQGGVSVVPTPPSPQVGSSMRQIHTPLYVDDSLEVQQAGESSTSLTTPVKSFSRADVSALQQESTPQSRSLEPVKRTVSMRDKLFSHAELGRTDSPTKAHTLTESEKAEAKAAKAKFVLFNALSF
jgi:hypothetical protein